MTYQVIATYVYSDGEVIIRKGVVTANTMYRAQYIAEIMYIAADSVNVAEVAL